MDEYFHGLGLLLKYNRKQKGLTQAQACEGICSRKTYILIENGNKNVKRESYQLIAERFGINATFYPLDLNDKYLKLCFHVLNFDKDNFKKEIKTIENTLNHSNDCIDREIFEILTQLSAVYLSKIKYENIIWNKYLELLSIYPSPIQSLIKNFYFSHISRTMKIVKMNNEVKKWNILDDSELMKRNSIQFYISNEMYLQAYDRANAMYGYFMRKKYIPAALTCLQFLAMIYYNVQPNHTDDIVNRIHIFFEEYSAIIPEQMIKNVLYQMSIRCILERQYENVVKYLKAIVHKGEKNILINIFYNFAALQLGEIQSVHFARIEKKETMYMYYCFYEYLINKYHYFEKKDDSSYHQMKKSFKVLELNETTWENPFKHIYLEEKIFIRKLHFK